MTRATYPQSCRRRQKERDFEVALSPGRPQFTIVGLPGKSVTESRDRVRSAILQSGFAFPGGKILVNLAPAFERKDGSPLDLPIALAILMVSGQAKTSSVPVG